MLKTICYLIIFLISTICYSQRIKSITEFKKEKDSLIKTRFSEFNKNGDLIKEIGFGGYDPILETYRNSYHFINYKDGHKISEYTCEKFVAKDTCVIRSFSKYNFNAKTETLKETKFESDSLIRFIRITQKNNQRKITKTYSWFIPTKKPNYEKALILIDTTYFDKKNRIRKRINYSSTAQKPFIQLYKYSKNNYKYQTIGTARDTIITYKYTDLQKSIDNQDIEYNFKNDKNYSYKITYY